MYSPQQLDKSAKGFWQALRYWLQFEPLNCSTGARYADVEEFMLMHADETDQGTVVGFKHCNTRNYVFLLHDKLSPRGCIHWRLHAPCNSEPFMRGDFTLAY